MKAAAIVAAAAALFLSAGAYAQPFSTATECVALGQWVEAVADVRDSKADRDAHLAMIRKRNAGMPPVVIEILVAEARRVYAQAGKDGLQLGTEAAERCLLGLLQKGT